ncbi:MAG TPA: MqnA/MqnD/SBP family protein, partial [Bacteroidales bacterium]|nr:MqnA/MqnD/SBP family protein [Bacteroidales bacterium]
IPLGGIAIKRDMDKKLQFKINRILRKSVEYAFENPKSAYPYIKKHAQEMDEEVMYKHIELYVNNYTLDLGNDGKEAIKSLYEKASSLGIISPMNQQIFLT